MTPADTLLALAVRAESAAGPDRELFVEAFIAVYGKASADRSVADTTAWIAAWGRFNTFLDAGAYLDAAMTLVPEGCGWEAGNGGYARVIRPTGPAKSFWSRGCATTPLAICAASLRARAALASGVAK